jgi:hypothetical protein
LTYLSPEQVELPPSSTPRPPAVVLPSSSILHPAAPSPLVGLTADSWPPPIGSSPGGGGARPPGLLSPDLLWEASSPPRSARPRGLLPTSASWTPWPPPHLDQLDPAASFPPRRARPRGLLPTSASSTARPHPPHLGDPADSMEHGRKLSALDAEGERRGAGPRATVVASLLFSKLGFADGGVIHC